MRPNALVSPGLVKSGLRRFWPLWLVLFVGLLLTTVAPVYSAGIAIVHLVDMAAKIEAMELLWNATRIGSLLFALLASIMVSVALNEHLFDSRAATFIGSLPVKRRTVFASTCAVGLLALVAVLAVVALCLVPLRMVVGPLFSLLEVARWFVLTAALTFVMYAFAQLSCQLSGTRPVAVLLYVVINSLAVCLEVAVQLVVSTLQYGMSNAWDYKLDAIAPAVRLGEAVLDFATTSPQWQVIAIYAVVAVVVLVGSALLFERRNLEAAGESVVIPVLRPILKYLAGVSLALLFATLYCTLHYSSSVYGRPLGAPGALALAICMAVGGALGLLFADMIMRRSAHVLGRCWKGALVLAAVSVTFVGVCWFDLLGVAHRVPDAAQVEKVGIQCDYNGVSLLTSPENIADVCDLHRDIIAYGGEGNADNGYMTVLIDYQLKNGRTLTRSYPIFTQYAEYRSQMAPADEGALLIDRFGEIANTSEGRATRYANVLDAKKGALNYTIEYLVDASTGEYGRIELSADDAAGLVQNALRADLLEAPAGEALSGYGEKESTPYDAMLSVEDPATGATLLWLQLDETDTPHLLGWFHERYPDIELQRW